MALAQSTIPDAPPMDSSVDSAPSDAPLAASDADDKTPLLGESKRGAKKGGDQTQAQAEVSVAVEQSQVESKEDAKEEASAKGGEDTGEKAPAKQSRSCWQGFKDATWNNRSGWQRAAIWVGVPAALTGGGLGVAAAYGSTKAIAVATTVGEGIAFVGKGLSAAGAAIYSAGSFVHERFTLNSHHSSEVGEVGVSLSVAAVLGTTAGAALGRVATAAQNGYYKCRGYDRLEAEEQEQRREFSQLFEPSGTQQSDKVDIPLKSVVVEANGESKSAPDAREKTEKRRKTKAEVAKKMKSLPRSFLKRAREYVRNFEAVGLSIYEIEGQQELKLEHGCDRRGIKRFWNEHCVELLRDIILRQRLDGGKSKGRKDTQEAYDLLIGIGKFLVANEILEQADLQPQIALDKTEVEGIKVAPPPKPWAAKSCGEKAADVLWHNRSGWQRGTIVVGVAAGATAIAAALGDERALDFAKEVGDKIIVPVGGQMLEGMGRGFNASGNYLQEHFSPHGFHNSSIHNENVGEVGVDLAVATTVVAGTALLAGRAMTACAVRAAKPASVDTPVGGPAVAGESKGGDVPPPSLVDESASASASLGAAAAAQSGYGSVNGDAKTEAEVKEDSKRSTRSVVADETQRRLKERGQRASTGVAPHATLRLTITPTPAATPLYDEAAGLCKELVAAHAEYVAQFPNGSDKYTPRYDAAWQTGEAFCKRIVSQYDGNQPQKDATKAYKLVVAQMHAPETLLPELGGRAASAAAPRATR